MYMYIGVSQNDKPYSLCVFVSGECFRDTFWGVCFASVQHAILNALGARQKNKYAFGDVRTWIVLKNVCVCVYDGIDIVLDNVATSLNVHIDAWQTFSDTRNSLKVRAVHPLILYDH